MDKIASRAFPAFAIGFALYYAPAYSFTGATSVKFNGTAARPDTPRRLKCAASPNIHSATRKSLALPTSAMDLNECGMIDSL